ncbi:uncharacterized protein TM35_000481140 [Trypanosoma theileri]|uniref:Uncharacterized protein n=1 Tax=Trypanosoma theileri TaxID=67003 RepID=A0A1X0NI60_9TRYP|nr:uncharacterized protein TM35_000481140 [Trypanosoma theileri]ORC84153.1 hypothetical protein TM35_000481140 [Trypanosoma theileri]
MTDQLLTLILEYLNRFSFLIVLFVSKGLSYPWMECRFCCSETKLEEVDGFKACCRCVGKIVPFCRAVVRQVVNELPGKGWDVKVIADEEEWLEALSLVVKNECGLWGEGRKAIVFAIRCKKDDITTFTLVDRLSVLAATSAAISRVLTSPKQPTRRKGP